MASDALAAVGLALVAGFAFGCGNALAKWLIWRHCREIQRMTWERLNGRSQRRD